MFLLLVAMFLAIHFRSEYNYFRSRNTVATAIRSFASPIVISRQPINQAGLDQIMTYETTYA